MCVLFMHFDFSCLLSLGVVALVGWVPVRQAGHEENPQIKISRPVYLGIIAGNNALIHQI